jgi:hypothetical protein
MTNRLRKVFADSFVAVHRLAAGSDVVTKEKV